MLRARLPVVGENAGRFGAVWQLTLSATDANRFVLAVAPDARRRQVLCEPLAITQRPDETVGRSRTAVVLATGKHSGRQSLRALTTRCVAINDPRRSSASSRTVTSRECGELRSRTSESCCRTTGYHAALRD